MRGLFLGVLLFGLAGVANAAETDREAWRASAGDWRLSEVGGRVACTLTLTQESGLGGFAVRAPLACRRAFPPLMSVAAWAMDDHGGIVLSDAERKPIITFPEEGGSSHEAKAPDGHTWRLDPVHASPAEVIAALSPRNRMSGAFRLSALGGTPLCDLILTSSLSGVHGALMASNCAPAWSGKAWSSWALRGEQLVLKDKDGATILALKPGDPGDYVTADPKADLLSLTRR